MTDSEEDRSDIPFHRTPQLIEYVSGRPPSDSPYLSKSTAEYILNRAAKSGTEKGNERDIEDVLQDLPLRVTRLISDIAILSNGGYLDDLDQNWDLLRSIPGQPENLNLRKALRRQTVSSGETHYFDLGVDVGLALSALTGAQSEDSRGKEFLAGFRTAYSTDVNQKEHTEPSNNTNDFEIDPERKQILERNGVEPTKYIARLIQDYNQGRHAIKGEGSISTEEATRKYLEEHLDDWFWKCCKVRHKLEEEWSTIEEAGNPGMGAEETLSALWDLKFPPGGTKRTTSTAIAKRAGKNSSYKKSVSQVLNRLSAKGKQPSSDVELTYESKEIVQHNGRGWNLTPYGTLLLYHVSVKENQSTWIQEAAIQVKLPLDQGLGQYTETDEKILERGVKHYNNG